VGDPDFCAALVRKRRAKAAKVMGKICALSDSQASLFLLGVCSGFSKLVISARTCPPGSINGELRHFDSDVRSCFCEALRLQLSDGEWERAQWASKLGGLSLRSAALHSSAAFVSSSLQTAELQCALWPGLSVDAVLSEQAFVDAVGSLSALLPPSLVVSLCIGMRVSHSVLSRASDRSQHDLVLTNPATLVHLKAHLQPMSAEGSDGRVHALPCAESRTKLPSELHRIAVARRLRLKLLHENAGVGLDVYMDHALVCMCGGTALFATMRSGMSYARALARPVLRPKRRSPVCCPPDQVTKR